MNLKELFPKISKAIYRSHIEAGQPFFGHDFDHAFRVGRYAAIIIEDENLRELAGACGLCHNADRILQKQLGIGEYGEVPSNLIEELVKKWLASEPDRFTSEEINMLIEAILKHSEKNKPDDSPLLVALKDADRLANIEADIVMREGQFMPNLRIVDTHLLLDDKEASYLNPKSVLKHIHELLDWEIEGGDVGMRLPKARELAKSRFDFLKLYLQTVIDQRKESGLVPYPTFE